MRIRLAAALALLACGPPADSPHRLWLAPDGGEGSVRLDDSEPDPF